MSVPALRQPKIQKKAISTAKNISPKSKPLTNKQVLKESQYMIITLKDSSKFVVSSDSYHGIIIAGSVYKCVFCKTDIILDAIFKERHTNSAGHIKRMETYPHIEIYAENLVRQLDKDNFYCTICNVLVSRAFISRHITSEVHLQQLERAGSRSDTYKEAC